MNKTQRIIAQRAADQLAKDNAYIASLQASLKSGQHLLTCPYCHKIVKVPSWQSMISCIHEYGGTRTPTHPGEILNSRR